MGLSTQHVHVFCPEGDAEGRVEAVVGVVREMMAKSGLRETAEEGDREIVLVPRGRWVTVLDSDFSQHAAVLKQVAKGLGGYVVGMQIADSDSYAGELYVGGKRVDWTGISEAGRGRKAKAELWAPVLVEGGEADLVQAGRADGVFAEVPMGHLSAALGVERGEMAGESGARVLRFAGERYVVPEAQLLVVQQGARAVRVGQVEAAVVVAIANEGKERCGVTVRVGGEAVERGLVEPVGVRVVWMEPVKGGGWRGAELQYAMGRESGGWGVEMPEIAMRMRLDPRKMPEGAGQVKAARVFHRHVVHLHVGLRGCAVGEGEVRVGVEWLGESGGGVEAVVGMVVGQEHAPE